MSNKNSILAITIALFTFAASLSAQVTRGWQQIDLPETEATAIRLIVPEIDLSEPQPLIVFLHGAGGNPELYRTFLIAAAREVGVPMVMPQASDPRGWGFGNDAERVHEAIAVLQDTIDIDPERIGITGHSAGGGFAMLLGLDPDSIFNGVFQLASPFVEVAALPENYSPPLRQYYGTQDPNYDAARPALNQQWTELELSFEEQIEPGFGHSDWPDGALEAGFQFLLDRPRPASTLPGFEEEPPPPQSCTTDTTLCLLDDRFEVTVHWTDHVGNQGQGHVVPGASSDSGNLWFFAPANWELLVKILDGCGVNGQVWVYSAATTDVAYTLTVRDRESGAFRQYSNAAGEAARAVTDTAAFAACPLAD